MLVKFLFDFRCLLLNAICLAVFSRSFSSGCPKVFYFELIGNHHKANHLGVHNGHPHLGIGNAIDFIVQKAVRFEALSLIELVAETLEWNDSQVN